jgi:hypothetical protein
MRLLPTQLAPPLAPAWHYSIRRVEPFEARRVNVWILVSSFNTRARRFYARQGYTEIGTLTDFVQPGCDEVLLRKVL